MTDINTAKLDYCQHRMISAERRLQEVGLDSDESAACMKEFASAVDETIMAMIKFRADFQVLMSRKGAE